jgi:transcription elongation factor Elf1
MANLAPSIGRECAHCKTEHTPLWRQGPEGEIFCNACGLYLKQHGQLRPLKLTQNPSLPKKKWRIPKGDDLFCSNCETRATPIWRRSPEGSLLCNACGLHLRIHNEHRPKVMKAESFKKRGPLASKKKRSKGSENNEDDGEDDDGGDEEEEEDGEDGEDRTYSSRSPSSVSQKRQQQFQYYLDQHGRPPPSIDTTDFVTTTTISRESFPEERYKEEVENPMSPFHFEPKIEDDHMSSFSMAGPQGNSYFSAVGSQQQQQQQQQQQRYNSFPVPSVMPPPALGFSSSSHPAMIHGSSATPLPYNFKAPVFNAMFSVAPSSSLNATSTSSQAPYLNDRTL